MSMSNRLRIGLVILGAVLVLGLVGLFIFLRTRDVDPPSNGTPKTSGTQNVVEEVIELPPDQDGDGLKDSTEAELGTDPANPDTDGDGATDFDEVSRLSTDPLKADASINARAELPPEQPVSEEDEEAAAEPEPAPAPAPAPTASPDPDGDGLTTLQEEQIGSDPNKADTDGDGFSDGEEVNAGYNPVGPGRRQ